LFWQVVDALKVFSVQALHKNGDQVRDAQRQVICFCEKLFYDEACEFSIFLNWVAEALEEKFLD